jgi:AbrB family looped-hinge helix DNA binding protein
MPIVKIGQSRQVVIPKKIHAALKLKPGDLLDVEIRTGEVVFTPKALVDRQLAEALEDIKHGRVSESFGSAQELLASLRPVRKRRQTRSPRA